MAVYKVAQDVEADDHLLGPFTARQFIYLIVVAMAGALAYFLGNLFLPLMIIPLPVILFFGALSLPLRKDQPMEVYMAAMVSYYLKPRKRFWIPDGVTSLVEIIAPRELEEQRTKAFSNAEAAERLSYLADIVDTEGWAIRHTATASPFQNTSMISDVYNDAQATPDPLDNDGTIAQSFNTMIASADQKHREQVIAKMHQAPANTPQIATQPLYQDPYANLATTPAPQNVQFNPYPTIHQSVIQPLSASDQVTVSPAVAPPTVAPVAPTSPTPAQTAKSTSETAMPPDIIKLVNNADLSIETIAREAHRITEKDEGEEVIISLR